MNEEQKLEVMETIRLVYPNFMDKDLNRARRKKVLWFRLLENMDFDRVMKKLDEHILISPYEPKISDIAAVKEKIKTIDEYEKEMFE